MALIAYGRSRCPLCNGILADTPDMVATSHFIADPSDPLFRYSDAGMHRDCFVAWPHRFEFTTRYNAVQTPALDTGLQKYMQPDGRMSWRHPTECAPPAD